MNRPVTVWEVWDDNSESWQHNHIEDGHITDDTPTARFENQAGWARRTWRKKHVHITDDNVIVEEQD